MNIEELRTYCLAKPFVEESFPFDNETLVFKVMDKLFLLSGINNQPLQFNVKCNPEDAIELREQHSCVLPGYHMNKQHWNTIVLSGEIDWPEVQGFITHSYNLVAQG